MNLNIKAINLIFLIFIFISLFSIKNIINASECKINDNVVETDDTCIGEIKNTNSSVFGKFENKQNLLMILFMLEAQKILNLKGMVLENIQMGMNLLEILKMIFSEKVYKMKTPVL